MQPLIGISCSYDEDLGRFYLPGGYIESVIKAGGVPVILPGAGSIKTVSPYFAVIKGLILAGGGDVDPTHFNEEPLPGLGEITPERDRFEMMLVKNALRVNLPILGICRGIQVLNVACGGTLVQHIPLGIKRPLKHSQSAPRWYPTHKVLIEKSSSLGEIFKKNSIRVNSFHHQAVRDPGPGLSISAVSNDGIIEGIEHPGHRFVIGVQWHPECMVEKDKYSRLLFKAFVEAARKTDSGRGKI